MQTALVIIHTFLVVTIYHYGMRDKIDDLQATIEAQCGVASEGTGDGSE